MRHEVEALVTAKSGKDQVHRKKLERELADLTTEARKIKSRLKAIERRRTELTNELASSPDSEETGVARNRERK